MFKSKTICYLTLAVFIVCLVACKTDKTVGGSFSMSRSTESTDGRFIAIPVKTESVIDGVNIIYERNSQGCIENCEFLNNPARCLGNKECQEYVTDKKAEFIECLSATTEPKIAGQAIKSAGYTTGPVQTCNEYIIVTSGSPGWVYQQVGGQNKLVCLGYYYAPKELCCDQVTCVEKP